ncbi:MAG: HD domain-containing protein [Phycisphaerales bacterium]|nr:MAG: HD domain-containing protein [Phycisphaerales bacterium]
MANLESIWQRARTDLTIDDGRGQRDTFLWEHSARVARAAVIIAEVPDISPRPLDTTALVAAALYHDAGWIVQCREGLVERSEILVRATCDLQRELAAAMLEERLGSSLPARSLDAAVVAVRRLNDRDVTLPEAHVLADSDNLDCIGALSFWQTVRRCSNDGKGMQAAIETWKRQKEYHFWEARIADAFRFEPVRELARERLSQFSEFMDALAWQHGGEDVARLKGVRTGSSSQRLPSI